MMRCTDFEKQFLLEGGLNSQPLWEHYASCAECRQYVQAHELLLPASVPMPAPTLDFQVCQLARAAMRRQRRLHRWRQLALPLVRLAAALVLCLGLWYFLGGQSGETASDSHLASADALASTAITEDPWLMEWALAYSELDDLEIDLTLHTALAGNWTAGTEQNYLPAKTDALQDLSNELMMLEFDLYENL